MERRYTLIKFSDMMLEDFDFHKDLCFEITFEYAKQICFDIAKKENINKISIIYRLQDEDEGNYYCFLTYNNIINVYNRILFNICYHDSMLGLHISITRIDKLPFHDFYDYKSFFEHVSHLRDDMYIIKK